MDKGQDLRKSAVQVQMLCTKLGLEVHLECPRLLSQRSEEWAGVLNDATQEIKKSAKNYSYFDWKVSWARLNNNLWKPTLIWEHLNSEHIDHGSYLVFHDINTEKYPVYLDNIEVVGRLVDQMEKKKMSVGVFTDRQMMLTSDSKQELNRRELGCDGSSFVHLWIGCIIVRKDETGLQFVKDWLDMTRKDDNRHPQTDYGRYSGYVWHSPEQATVGVTYYKWVAGNRRKSRVRLFELDSSRRLRDMIRPSLHFRCMLLIYRLRYLKRYWQYRHDISQVKKVIQGKWR